MRNQICHSWALALLTFLVAACGGASGAFSPTFPDSREADIEHVLARVEAAPARPTSSISVGVTEGASPQLFAYDLRAARMLWSIPTHTAVTPVVAGDTVITDENRQITGHDLRTGHETFTLDSEALHLVGGDGEGRLGVFVLSTGGGVIASSKIIMIDGDSIRWTRTAEHACGVPAIHAGLVFVPWGNQNISVLDADSADETARIRIRDDVVGHAFVEGTHVYVGQAGLFRLTPSIAHGTKAEAAYLAVHTPDLPGRPAFLPDAYVPPANASSAAHSVRFAWRPTGTGEEVHLVDDSLYLVFYRTVVALDPSAENVRWVHQSTEDIVGASVQSNGLLVADHTGVLTLLDHADGRPGWHGNLGVAPSSIELGTGDLALQSSPVGEVRPLRDQLTSAAEDTDSRLVPVRVLAVHWLAALEDDAVTENLVSICSAPRVPPSVHNAACVALSERTRSDDHVIAALERHASFLQGTTVPPVGALAQAATRMQERRAIPLLIAQLRDPQTPVEDLPAVVNALKVLGDRSVVDSLEDFLRLYHAEEPTDALTSALSLSVDALVALAGPVAADTLREIADDALGIGQVRSRAAAALEGLGAVSAAAQQADEVRQTGVQATTDTAEADTDADARPEMLTMQHVEAALSPVMNDLQTCMRQDRTHPPSVRIVIVVDGDGVVQQVTTQPPTAQACITPFVSGATFPANRRGSRQVLTYTLRR
ncbi:MAG: PQQ-binding-like beta-propeller repeat protein [Sandaracinaceae bacterium]|nr:PQQ-binding-like beta-propeller repeat protein [Sandaracinaceae bacterium]